MLISKHFDQISNRPAPIYYWHCLKLLYWSIEGAEIFIELVELPEIEAGRCAETAGPNDARYDYGDIKSLGNLGLLNELAELADDEERPNERDEEQEAETEKRKYCQRDGSHRRSLTNFLFLNLVYNASFKIYCLWSIDHFNYKLNLM